VRPIRKPSRGCGRKDTSRRSDAFGMAREKGEGPVTLSVLDRLIDEEPKSSQEVPLTRAESLRRLKAGVRRDLEWLLNAREPVQQAPEGASELEKSVYCFGLPDICSMNLMSVRNRGDLARLMEMAVAQFEPRLISPKVSVVPTAKGALPQLRFAIEGLLAIDPMPEHVSFDTVLEITDGEYQVRGEPGAG
jgi:type VI secretion system protein ImpF